MEAAHAFVHTVVGIPRPPFPSRRKAFFMRQLSALLAILFLAVPAGHAGQERLAGNWKITFFDRGDLVTFWLLKLESKDRKVTGKLVTVPKGPEATLEEVTAKDDQLKFVLKFQDEPVTFVCKLPKGELKKLRGNMSLGNLVFPVQLEATKLEDLKDVEPFGQAPPPKGNFQELKAALAKQKDDLAVFEVAEVLVSAAANDKVPAADLKEVLTTALKLAQEYGDVWMQEMRFLLAARLAGREAFAGLGEEMIQQALKAMGPAAGAELQLRGLGVLTSALQTQNKTAELAKIQEQVSILEVKGHEENEKAGLGFTPGKFAGRKGNRVVLVELFTGAQCPPCVAADLAFEGLGKTYKTSEVVLLQYHLHIPGPDALANQDTIARQSYYGNKKVRGTPSIFFNGVLAPEPAVYGGGKGQAGAKYKEYRDLIDPLVVGSTKVTLNLDARRAGDVITITAAAGGYAPNDTIRLRFALVEPWVRYPGGNGLSYHAYVVRALPGGPKGFALAKDNAKETVKIDLVELRKAASKFLDSEKALDGQRPFRFRNLRVVAFIQNDATQEVLHAVEVAVTK
jgi:hypothetical protein